MMTEMTLSLGAAEGRNLNENPSHANLFAEADVDDDMISHWMMFVGDEEIVIVVDE